MNLIQVEYTGSTWPARPVGAAAVMWVSTKHANAPYPPTQPTSPTGMAIGDILVRHPGGYGMIAPLRVYTEPHILRGQGLDPVDLRLDPGSQAEVARPEGPGYVRYEDLYQPGDTVQEALDRMTEPAVVTFPEGVFELHGFPRHGGALDCTRAFVRGIIGSGSGLIHDPNSTGTIFQLVEGSSPYVTGDPLVPHQGAGGTTQLRVIRAVNIEGDAIFKNFQIRGSEQGHVFHGLGIIDPAGGIVVSNVKVSGIAGDYGYPPGETFSISAYGGGTRGVLIENCEVDGRFSGDKRAVSESASGITIGRAIGATVKNCYTHHSGGSAMVLYRAFDVTHENCIMGTTELTTHNRGPTLRPSSVNNEEAAGISYLNCSFPGSTIAPTVHINHSNTDRSFVIDGVSRSVVDGSLEVVNPRYTDIRGSKNLYVQSWRTGVDGTTDNDSMVTPPTVLGPDGTTPMRYVWAHGGSTVINPAGVPTEDSILEEGKPV